MSEFPGPFRRRPILQLFAVVAGLAVVGSAPQALAWGATGHRLIGRVAIQALPDETPAFLRARATVDAVGELAREPDRSKGTGEPHDNDLNAAHFVDADDQGRVGGGPPLNDLPATRAAYEAALHAIGTDGYQQGYLPYSIAEGWQQLVKDLAYWRVDDWASHHAKTAEDRKWFARDLALREQLTVRDLGFWAHFVGDGSQPLHVSLHFNGWGAYPNPKGYTTDKVHASFEGAFVRNNVGEAQVLAAVRPYADCHCPIQRRTADYLKQTLDQVEPFYALQKQGGFVGADGRGAAFAAARLAAGASELRDLIVDAWRASATMSVGYPAITPADVEAGRVDPYGPLFGED